jgi:hypothetical protein
MFQYKNASDVMTPLRHLVTTPWMGDQPDTSDNKSMTPSVRAAIVI